MATSHRIDRSNACNLSALTLLVWTVSCGITQPKYIDYSDEDADEAAAPNENSTECQAAATAFAAQIQPTLDADCVLAGCHATTKIAGGNIKAGDAVTSRTTLRKYVNEEAGGSGATLFAFISGPHPGGPKGDKLTQAKIDAWLAQEQACK